MQIGLQDLPPCGVPRPTFSMRRRAFCQGCCPRRFCNLLLGVSARSNNPRSTTQGTDALRQHGLFYISKGNSNSRHLRGTPCKSLAEVLHSCDIRLQHAPFNDVASLQSWDFGGAAAEKQVPHKNQCGTGNVGDDVGSDSKVWEFVGYQEAQTSY